MRLLKYSLALLAFAASSSTFASSVDKDYDSGAYESGGNLLVKIRGCAIITDGNLKSLPATDKRPQHNQNNPVSAKRSLKNGYGIENANTLFFADHFATELSIGLSAYILPQTGLQKIYNNYAKGTPGNISIVGTEDLSTPYATSTLDKAVDGVVNVTAGPNTGDLTGGVYPGHYNSSGTEVATTTTISGSYPPSYNTKRHLLMGIPLNLTLQYHIAPYGAIRPYVGIGGNFTYFTSKAKEYTVKPAYGLVLQAGVDIVMTDDTVISIDMKYTKLAPKITFKSSFLNGADAVSSKMKMDPFIISAGLGFKL